MARRLELPLTTWAVRKLALPTSPEFAIGAIAPGGVELWDPASSRGLQQHPELRRMILEREAQELLRRQQLFGDAAPERLAGRELIVVDDGIATGLTVRAALLSLRQLNPARLILAVPVVTRRVLAELEPLLDEAVVLAPVDDLLAVGCHYFRFEQLSDNDVLALPLKILVISGTSRINTLSHSRSPPLNSGLSVPRSRASRFACAIVELPRR